MVSIVNVVVALTVESNANSTIKILEDILRSIGQDVGRLVFITDLDTARNYGRLLATHTHRNASIIVFNNANGEENALRIMVEYTPSILVDCDTRNRLGYLVHLLRGYSGRYISCRDDYNEG